MVDALKRHARRVALRPCEYLRSETIPRSIFPSS